MAQICFDFPSSFFAVLLKSPSELAVEMRLVAAIHWHSQGVVSQGKAAEIAGVSHAAFLEELHRRNVPAIQVTVEELARSRSRSSRRS